MEFKKYRKKPVVLEAFQLTPELLQQKKYKEEFIEGGKIVFHETYAIIETSDGIMMVNEGDYIVTDENGGVYPYKKEIFEETYEIYNDFDDAGEEFTFDGYDWSELLVCWDIPHITDGGEPRDDIELLEEIIEFINEAKLGGYLEPVAEDLRNFLKALVGNLGQEDPAGEKQLWEGLLNIKDDRYFVTYCQPLLPYMWI